MPCLTPTSTLNMADLNDDGVYEVVADNVTRWQVLELARLQDVPSKAVQ